MFPAYLTEPWQPTDPGDALVEIVVPVHNEEAGLDAGIRRLRTYLDESFPFTALVTICDNGSIDATAEIGAALAATVDGVRLVRLTAKGRGLALRSVWSASEAAVVAYMDVDLSTSLEALLPLVAPLLSGHSDLAIGSRLAPGARVVRGPKRELISRAYNLILRASLRNRFTDAQCGFKALRTEVAKELLPDVSDNAWFFDTELLVLAERRGLRIHEVPVDWVDDPDSRVNIVRTALDDLRGVTRLLRSRSPLGSAGDGRAEDEGAADLAAALVSFARIGVASTMASLVLFVLLRHPLGVYGANTLALGVCTVANTAAHARLTFADRRPFRRRDRWMGGLAVFATSLALSTGALAAVNALGVGSTRDQVAALVAASAAAALIRFLVLRAWAFRSRPTR